MVAAHVEYSALLRKPSDVALARRTDKTHTNSKIPAPLITQPLFHLFCERPQCPPTPSLTQVLRVDERGLALRVGPSAPGRSPAALPVVKLATGNVHLMQGGVNARRQHAWTVGVQVETAFVADDGLVHAALVALALVVRLRSITVKLSV